MAVQPSLFDFPPSPAPVAANADPFTSHLAGNAERESGRMGRHEAIALAMVRRRPGLTFHELWAEVATSAERDELGDTTELMRRLGGMKPCDDPGHERPGFVKHGPKRKCRINGRLMVTWELVSEDLA